MASLVSKKGLLLGLLAVVLLGGIFYLGLWIGKGVGATPEAVAGGEAAAETAAGAQGAAEEAIAGLLGKKQEPVFAIQVGDYLIKEDCETVLADLQSRGYAAYVVQIKDADRLLHRIHVGPYPTFEAAEEAAEQFTLEEEIEALPIRARSGPVTPAEEAEPEPEAG